VLTAWREEVADRMTAGAGISRTEDWINDLPASEMEKAGLWLLAFSMLGQASQFRLIEHYFAAAAAAPV
jgi:hypothetical protein